MYNLPSVAIQKSLSAKAVVLVFIPINGVSILIVSFLVGIVDATEGEGCGDIVGTKVQRS